MGTLTGTYIATNVRATLQDVAGVRSADAEVLRYINDGQREIVTLVPSAFSKHAIVVLATGTKQTAAGLGLSDCVQLVRFNRNYAADGTTVGSVITRCDRNALDDEIPGWHLATAASEAVHDMADPEDPKTLWIYPPVTAGRRGDVFYYAMPPDLAALANAIALDDIYANPLTNYVLFRLLTKRTKGNTTAKQEAGGYYNLMANELGVKVKNQVATGGSAE